MSSTTIALLSVIFLLLLIIGLLSWQYGELDKKYKELTGDKKPKKEKFIGRNNFGGRPQLF
jgi:hypothetical protein